MPNSSCITQWKRRILSELQNDDEILEALGTTEEEREDLIYTRIYPHYYIPETVTEVTTYIMVEIDIRSLSRTNVYSYPMITFVILAHQDDMKLELPSVSATRIDYLGELLDRKYNGATGFGVGKLELKQNYAGNLNDTFRTRTLVFQGMDVNQNLCEI